MTMVPCPRGNRPWRDHANWSRMFVKPLEVACTIVVRDADLRGCEGGANDCRPVVQVFPAEAIDD
jgi:hypothetical protein